MVGWGRRGRDGSGGVGNYTERYARPPALAGGRGVWNEHEEATADEGESVVRRRRNVADGDEEPH